MVLGVIKFGKAWAIPVDAERPVDKRIKSGKYIKNQKWVKMQKYEIFDVILGLSPYLWTRLDLELEKIVKP